MKNYYDIAGDGGSRIVEQVEAQQKKIAGKLSEVGNIVAIGSGKGGVGKSTMTMQLAWALRDLGHSVSILDADLNGPSQARLAMLHDWVPVPGEHGVALPKNAGGIGVVSLGAIVPEPRAVDFQSVAPGSSQTWRGTRELALLRELLASMEWGSLDFLLIDLPPGAERIVQYAELLGESAVFVLVTIPSDLSRGVVARSIDALSRTPNRVIGYIQNMDGYFCADCGRIKPLFPDSSSVDLGLPRLGTVPFDPELAALCDRGGSLADAEESAAWKPVLRTAEALLAAVSAGALLEKENG